MRGTSNACLENQLKPELGRELYSTVVVAFELLLIEPSTSAGLCSPADTTMTTTSVHPLSGFGKAWPVPDFSLEGRRAKASTTLPVGLFILGDSRSPSTTLKHPDEEKGRSLRSSSRSTSTNGLFASSDAVNRATSFAADGAFIQPSFDSVRLPDALLPSSDDDADDSFLDSWVNSGGARAAAAADVDSASAARRSPEPAPLAWVPSSWTTAIDKAVMNANGCIQLR